LIKIAITEAAFEAIAERSRSATSDMRTRSTPRGNADLAGTGRWSTDCARCAGWVSRRGRDLGFTRRCQCGPCDLNRLRNSLGDFGARLCGIVSCPKRERKNGLPTFVEDIKAKAQVRHPRDFAHCTVLVYEARHVFGGGSGDAARSLRWCKKEGNGRRRHVGESSRTPAISAAMRQPTSSSRGSSSGICASGSPTPIGCSRTKFGRC
jgi:hypothetical protein